MSNTGRIEGRSAADPGTAAGHIGWPRLLLGAALLFPAIAHAQVGVAPGQPALAPAPPPAQPVLPAFPQTSATMGVVADEARIYGDDAPTAGGFDILAGIGFHMSASLVTEYNDNISRTVTGEPLNPRFKSKTDWRFTPTVAADFGRAFGRQRLFLTGSVGRDYYARNNIMNRNRFQVDGGLQWTLGTRCNGRAQGGYSDRGTRLSDFDEVIPSSQTSSSLSLVAGCATATGLGFNAGYNWNELKNSVESREYADSRGSGINGSIFYKLGQRGDISIQGYSRSVTYPNQFLPDGQSNGTDISSLSLGLGYRFGPSIRLNGDIGKSWADPKNPLAEGFSGLTWNLAASYSGPRLGGRISAGRGVSSGSGGYTNYQLSDRFAAALTYDFGRRIVISTGYSHLNQRNRGGEGLPETSRLSEFKLDRIFIGADYRLNRILTVGFDVNNQKRSANPSDFNYTATSALLTLRARI